MPVGTIARSSTRAYSKVTVIGMIEQVECLDGDDRMIALLDLEVLLQAGVDTVVVCPAETVALYDVIPITGVIGDLRKGGIYRRA